MSKKAIADFESLHAENPSHTRVAQLLAEEYASATDIYEHMAAAARGADRRAAFWREARASIGHALDLWRDLERRGAVDADRRVRLAEMSAVLTRCDAALAELSTSR